VKRLTVPANDAGRCLPTAPPQPQPPPPPQPLPTPPPRPQGRRISTVSDGRPAGGPQAGWRAPALPAPSAPPLPALALLARSRNEPPLSLRCPLPLPPPPPSPRPPRASGLVRCPCSTVCLAPCANTCCCCCCCRVGCGEVVSPAIISAGVTNLTLEGCVRMPWCSSHWKYGTPRMVPVDSMAPATKGTVSMATRN
jgi:hypothetical protein